MNRFSKILIANRGEIACRVIRTARDLGYHTVAVFTKADEMTPHVSSADEAVCIGAGPAGESYLQIDKILAAAKSSGAQAIHPGYGFLSENAEFARACEQAGLVFIGPGVEAIQVMGNKAEAKRRMLQAGVPCIPGYEGASQDDDVLVSEAKKIGMPVMVKAAAGGGGRGMRLVHKSDDLRNAIRLARSEAEKAFGNGELILEKAILRPRHVEIQVFADSQGNTISLGERDCSVQRRHQKVLEEAPCSVMSAQLRENMGKAATAVAKSVSYQGAGTVEFLLDDNHDFYFLEMNTRLQVEHPVTELVTGLDLVALQIQVAQGEPLGLQQSDVQLKGHAIEARLYAEDPEQDFLPQSGPVHLWVPASAAGIRIDSGVCTGQKVSSFYDPMVAKIIAFGASREIARRRLIGALNETILFGVKTNKQFLVECLEKPVFAEARATTSFIEEEFGPSAARDSVPTFSDAAVAAVLDLQQLYRLASETAVLSSVQLKNWASAGALVSHRQYQFNDTLYDLEISPVTTKAGKHRYHVSATGQEVIIELLSVDGPVAHVGIDGHQNTARFLAPEIGQLYLMINGSSAFYQDQILLAGSPGEAAGSGRVTAPMHGLLMDIAVKTGDTVSQGQSLLVLEAMKMQHEVRASISGTIAEICVKTGDQVSADDVLIDITAEELKEKS